MSSIVLRYFDVRGRGQALRDTLMDAGVDFVDEKIPVGPEWRPIKQSPQGGAFGSLPVLEWDSDRVAQALAIAGYLSRRLGYYDGLDDMGIARLEMVASAVYLDVTTPLAMMMRPPVPLTSENEVAFFTETESRVLSSLTRLEALLSASDDPFFGKARPVPPDFFLFEAIAALRVAFGARFETWLSGHARLRSHEDAVAARPAIARYLAAGERPARLTGSPHEPAVRERLQSFAATPV